MTRRTLIATLLAAILAPFRGAKAAPVDVAQLAAKRVPIYELAPGGSLRFVRYGTGEIKPGRVRVAVGYARITEAEMAKFGLCAKCGGLTCVCD